MPGDTESGIHACFGERIQVPARLSEVDNLRRRLADFLSRYEVSPEATGLWVLVLTEAAVNAMRHGCGLNASLSIRVCWWIEGQTINLEVSDPGQGPPPDASSMPSLPEDPLAPGGRGLFLIQGYVDRREEWRGPGGYRLLLAKSHPEIRLHKDKEETIMEQTLMELSASYESLAAFYRLGEGLAASENVSRFIHHAMRDLAKAVTHDAAWLAFTGAASGVVDRDTAGISCMVAMADVTAAERKVWEKDRELIWDEQTNADPIPGLREFHAGVCCPVHAGGLPRGIITLVRREGPGFTAGELSTLRTFADIFGIAVLNAANTNARKEEALALRELEIASELQNRLLPMPTMEHGPGWNVTTRRVGARQVSGDHVEVITCRNGDTILAMVDVMGKGVPAAFLAAIFRTALHITLTFQYSLVGLMLTLNRALAAQLGDLTMFATCALVRIPETSGFVEVVNAGHCPALLVSPNGTTREMVSQSPPLGLFTDAEFSSQTLSVQPGEKLFLVTDGLYEWQHGDDIWGWENLRAFLKEHHTLPGATIWDLLSAYIQETQTEQDESRDDRTYLCWEKTAII